MRLSPLENKKEQLHGLLSSIVTFSCYSFMIKKALKPFLFITNQVQGQGVPRIENGA